MNWIRIKDVYQKQDENMIRVKEYIDDTNKILSNIITENQEELKEKSLSNKNSIINKIIEENKNIKIREEEIDKNILDIIKKIDESTSKLANSILVSQRDLKDKIESGESNILEKIASENEAIKISEEEIIGKLTKIESMLNENKKEVSSIQEEIKNINLELKNISELTRIMIINNMSSVIEEILNTKYITNIYIIIVKNIYK